MGTKRVLMAMVVVAVALATGCVFEVEDLGGEYSVATDINNHGVLVGFAEPLDDEPGVQTLHAFKRLPDGTVVDLGSEFSTASDINDSGFVVGTSLGERGTEAVRWDPSGAMTDVGVPGADSRAYAINEAGVIVGDAYIAGRQTAYVFDPAVGHGVPLPLPPGLSDYSAALRISEAGKAVGRVGETAVMWDLETGTVTDLMGWTGLHRVQDITDSGALLGTDATGLVLVQPGSGDRIRVLDGEDGLPLQLGFASMNEDLTVVGWISSPPERTRAFRWSPESGLAWISTTDPWIEAYAVNDHDQIVGGSGLAVGEFNAAFLFPDQQPSVVSRPTVSAVVKDATR